MQLRRRADSVLRIVLSYMMMGWSRMSIENTSATSMTRSDGTIEAFATLRFVGDALDPDEISRAVKQQPMRAYRKGERYRPGPRSPELMGKTGLWYISTKRTVPSKNLADHLDTLTRFISPFADEDRRLKELREIMERRNLTAHATLFWRGAPGAASPSISSVATAPLQRLPADIEADFENEDDS
jgi:hypothetical protein